ncbi:MAG: hypothetical protein K2G45_12240 [Lachnospiraceae bacterium]|nr:hypothetical protein [Lachnospiraceae bacterium]
MDKKGLTKILSIFIICFYIAIIMYIFFAVLNINALVNYESALVFEIIGFVLLAYFVLGNIFAKPIKTGYFVPLIMITVIYTIVLNVVNLICVTYMANVFFVLINLIVLFVYCLISIPMYIMGRK